MSIKRLFVYNKSVQYTQNTILYVVRVLPVTWVTWPWLVLVGVEQVEEVAIIFCLTSLIFS